MLKMPTTKEFNPNATCPVLTRGAKKCPYGCRHSYVRCHFYRKGICYFQTQTSHCSLGWHQGDDESSKCDQTKRYTAPTRKRSKSPSEDSQRRKEKEPKAPRNREVELQREPTKRFAEQRRKEELVDLQIQLTRLGFRQHQLPTAREVDESLRKALRNLGPYEETKQENVKMFGDAFIAIMQAIRARREKENSTYPTTE